MFQLFKRRSLLYSIALILSYQAAALRGRMMNLVKPLIIERRAVAQPIQ